MSEDETTLAAIHRLYPEIVESSAKIRSTRDDLKDVAEQNDEYRGLQEDIAELKQKQTQAKEVLAHDGDYQTIKSELEELKFKHKDLLEILSHHLIAYRDETDSGFVEDPEGEARRIIMTAKLSKPDSIHKSAPGKKVLPGQVTIESQVEGYGLPRGGKK